MLGLNQSLFISMLDAIYGFFGKDEAIRTALLHVLRERTAAAGFALEAALDANSRDAQRDGSSLNIYLRLVLAAGAEETDLLTNASDRERKRWMDLLVEVEREGYPPSSFDILRDYPVPKPDKADNDE